MHQVLNAQQHGFSTYLTAQTKEALVALLLEVALRDDRLAQSLLVKSAPVGQKSQLALKLRQLIDDVTAVDGFVGWRSMRRFSEPLQQAVDTLAELLTPERADILVGLAQYAIEQTEAALEQLDDSGGEVGEVMDCLGDLHLKACALARPDPLALAHDLFRLETTMPFGRCSFSALTYQAVLGAQGLAAYRALAQESWDAYKPKGKHTDFNNDRLKLSRVMEDLARASGDVDGLIAIKSLDLGHPYAYLTIAELLTENKRHDEALQWAERGLAEHPERPDNRLRDLLVAAYLTRQRPAEALQLTWIQFEERPSLAHYQKLHTVALKLGVWPAQRLRALAHLAVDIAGNASQTNRHQPKPSVPDRSLRLAIALWEDDLDAAWATVQSGPCPQDLCISLAQALEATRAQDAVSLYRQVVPDLVGQTHNGAYARAAALIGKVGQLMAGWGQPQQFAVYVAQLRAQFKPKRNFIKLLDGLEAPR